MNRSAQQLGRMAKGKPKTLTKAETGLVPGLAVGAATDEASSLKRRYRKEGAA